jgi:hypothetical protein
MGFSFAGIRKELDSPELGKLFRRLQADCLYLAPFPDWHAVITFLHDRKRGYRLKDRILWWLIRCHQQGDQGKKLGVVFLAIFTPAILNIYKHGRKRCPFFGDEDLLQEICTLLLRMLRETKILSDKVAIRIVGQLRNDVRDLLDEKSREREWRPTDVPDLFGADADAWESQTHADESDIGALMDLLDVADARGLLDLLARRRVIEWEGKRIIEATLIGGKTLKEIALPEEYERLKYHRANTLKAIRDYLLAIQRMRKAP